MSLSPNGANASPNSNCQTPGALVEAARELLGGKIDLDPASCASANERVRAQEYCGPNHELPGERDGLTGTWGRGSRVFLNPPGSAFAPFWRKLLEEYAASRVSAAVFVCFSIDALQTTQNHNEGGVLAFPCFIPNKRIAYLSPVDGSVMGSPPKPSAIVWLPELDINTPPIEHLRLRLTDTMLRHGYGGISVGG